MNEEIYSQRQSLKDQLESNSIFFQNHHFEITSTYKDSNVLVNFKLFYSKKINYELINNLLIQKIEENKILVDLLDSSLICEIENFDNESIITLSSFISLDDLFIQVNQIELMMSSFLIVENKIKEQFS